MTIMTVENNSATLMKHDKKDQNIFKTILGKLEYKQSKI